MVYLLLDTLCDYSDFLGFLVSWQISEPYVHVYFNMLWKNKYKIYYAQICDFFMYRLYSLILGWKCPRLSKHPKKIMACIRNWYLEEKHTYLWIFGATNPPHLCPTYVPDRFLVGDQSIMKGFNDTLVKDKNKIFIPYNFQIWYYTVRDAKHAKVEGQI